MDMPYKGIICFLHVVLIWQALTKMTRLINYEGELIVLDKSQLKVVSEFALPSKMNDAELCDSLLVFSGINRFYLFDVSQPTFPR